MNGTQNIVTWIKNMAKSNKIPISCNHCGYKWGYSGDKERATCPSCSLKVKVEENRLDGKKIWKIELPNNTVVKKIKEKDGSISYRNQNGKLISESVAKEVKKRVNKDLNNE